MENTSTRSKKWKQLAEEFIADRFPEELQDPMRDVVFGCHCCGYSPGLRRAGQQHGVCHMRLHRWHGKLKAHMDAAEKLGHT